MSFLIDSTLIESTLFLKLSNNALCGGTALMAAVADDGGADVLAVAADETVAAGVVVLEEVGVTFGILVVVVALG